MPALLTLLLATPLFGLSLRAPDVSPVLAPETFAAESASRTLDEEAVRADADTRTIMEWTRALHLGATVTLGGAVVVGGIQFGDEYGFHGGRAETACANNSAVLNDCGGETPWPHALLGGTAAVLGISALLASTQVDFDRASRIDSDWRIYEVTRWATLGLFLLQGAIGFIGANAVDFGWAHPDRHFTTLQSLATAHLVLGGALTVLEAVNTALLF